MMQPRLGPAFRIVFCLKALREGVVAMMKAVRLYEIGDLRCVETPVPVAHGRELLVKIGACGICGSDISRVYEHGTSSGIYPLTIGHEFSGTVVQVGEDADPRLLGARGAVFPLIPCRECIPCRLGQYALCEHYDYMGSRRDGGFAEYCVIPSEWHLVRAQSASMEELAMVEPACVAQHAVRKALITGGQYVVIFGAGPIGILAAKWAQKFGARSLLVDIVPEKVAFARNIGFDAINSRETDIVQEIRSRNSGNLADAAIEGTGVGSVMDSCAECVHALGTIAMLGNAVDEPQMSAKCHQTILRKELTVNGVWNSARAPYPVDEWKYVVELMDSGELTVSDLITDRMRLEEIPQAIAGIRDGRRRTVKGLYLCQS